MAVFVHVWSDNAYDLNCLLNNNDARLPALQFKDSRILESLYQCCVFPERSIKVLLFQFTGC